MTHPHSDSTLLNQIVNQISTEGANAFAESLRLLLNHAMEVERSKVNFPRDGGQGERRERN